MLLLKLKAGTQYTLTCMVLFKISGKHWEIEGGETQKVHMQWGEGRGSVRSYACVQVWRKWGDGVRMLEVFAYILFNWPPWSNKSQLYGHAIWNCCL